MANEDFNYHMDLPWEILDTSCGFAMDIGGSAMKVLYIDKNDWKDAGSREQGTTGRIKLKYFPHEDFNNAIAAEFIKKNAFIETAGDQTPVIYGTGVGVKLKGRQLRQDLGISLQMLPETACFAAALAYIVKELPQCQSLYQLSAQDEESLIAEGKAMHYMVHTPSSSTPNQEGEDTADEPWCSPKKCFKDPVLPMISEKKDIFPCILVMCGSAFGALCVEEDGSFERIDFSQRGGLYWLGMGSVLTGAKNYDELMALAEKGCTETVDITHRDLYSTFHAASATRLEDGTPFEQLWLKSQNEKPKTRAHFGKVINIDNKTSIKEEDLARSFLNAMVADTVSFGMNAARIKGVRHVFYSGGFVKHHLVIHMINSQWIRKWCELQGFNKKMPAIEVHFLKHGTHLGALGALLHSSKTQKCP